MYINLVNDKDKDKGKKILSLYKDIDMEKKRTTQNFVQEKTSTSSTQC